MKKEVINILGDGIAGVVASLVFISKGHNVNHFCKEQSEKKHLNHVHVIKQSVLDVLERLDESLCALIREGVESDWTHNRKNKYLKICPKALLKEISAQINLNPLYSRYKSHSFLLSNINENDIYIDATGGQRYLVRALDRKGFGCLSLDEAGPHQVYITREFDSRNKSKELLTWRDDTHRVIVELDASTTKITSTIKDNLELNNILKKELGLSLPVEDPKDIFITQSPNIRKANFVSKSKVLMFGDSLIQLPAKTGFGIASIFEQAGLLNSNDFEENKRELDQYADALWMGSIFQEGLLST